MELQERYDPKDLYEIVMSTVWCALTRPDHNAKTLASDDVLSLEASLFGDRVGILISKCIPDVLNYCSTSQRRRNGL